MTDEELKAKFLTERGPTQCPTRKAANPRLKLALPKLFIPAAREHDPTADADDITAFNKRKSRRYSKRESIKLTKADRRRADRAEEDRRQHQLKLKAKRLDSIARRAAEVKRHSSPP